MDEDVDKAWPAPAKINRFLHIIGQRDDGYHLLQTVFQFLDYGDLLYFYPRDDGEIHRRYRHLHGPEPVTEEDDLVVRAARLLQRHSGQQQGVDIELDKRLPMGGGLGGGSSDAATVLVALNQIWSLGLNEDVLADLGLQLGADVPVFVHGQAAWAEGIGEQLTPLELDEPWFLVVSPPVNVSTADIFSSSELIRTKSAITIRDFLGGATMTNVMEPVVLKRYPEVKAAIDFLSRHAPARMTGSGACVFAMFAQQDEAERVFSLVPEEWTAFVARGCNRSPLLARRDAT